MVNEEQNLAYDCGWCFPVYHFLSLNHRRFVSRFTQTFRYPGFSVSSRTK